MAIMEREPLEEKTATTAAAKKLGLFIVDKNNVAQDSRGFALWDEYRAELEAVNMMFSESPNASFIVSDTIWDRSEDFMKGLRFSSLIVRRQDEARTLLETSGELPLIVYLNGAHGNELVPLLDEIILLTLMIELPSTDDPMRGPDLSDWSVTDHDSTLSVIRLPNDTAFMHAPTAIKRLKKNA